MTISVTNPEAREVFDTQPVRQAFDRVLKEDPRRRQVTGDEFRAGSPQLRNLTDIQLSEIAEKLGFEITLIGKLERDE